MNTGPLTTPALVSHVSSVQTRLSRIASELHGSDILRIGAEVRKVIASGKPVANLTVGDFSAREFSLPTELVDGIAAALRSGEYTYPPSDGVEALRDAVRAFYKERSNLDFARESILITAGARPAIYAFYRAVVSEGDHVVYGVPSWNNPHYVQMVGAHEHAIPCDASTNFHPTAAMLAPHLRSARLLALNSPLNPTGTMIDREVLADICDAVLEENARREGKDRPLYVMYDQVYWMITAGDVEHVHPTSLRPEITPYVVTVDAISKCFAATGIRVGWAAGPADIIKAMSDISTHAGAWAPRPEQVATAKLLCNTRAVDDYMDNMRSEAAVRLRTLADGLQRLAADGLPVKVVAPQGAIYVSAQFNLRGRKSPAGEPLDTNESIRRYLLEEAGLGVVPFQAFGLPGDSGWFRLSIGVVSVADIEALLPRIRGAITVAS